jgi:hypothetical protein
MVRAQVAAFVCAVCAAGCATAPETPPIARIATSPTAILVRDAFRTRVTIDGSASASLTEADTPLRFEWRFLDDEARTDDPRDAERLVVTFRGDRPPRIELTVTAPDGGEGTAVHQLLLTVRR